MKRKKGKREEGGGLACHGLCVSLCAASSQPQGLRWVGAECQSSPGGCGAAASMWGWIPGSAPQPLPTPAAAFQAEPQGRAVTAHPAFARLLKRCSHPTQTLLTHCSHPANPPKKNFFNGSVVKQQKVSSTCKASVVVGGVESPLEVF